MRLFLKIKTKSVIFAAAGFLGLGAFQGALADDVDVLGEFLSQQQATATTGTAPAVRAGTPVAVRAEPARTAAVAARPLDPIAGFATPQQRLAQSAQMEGPLLNSQAALIMDERSGKVLYAKNTDRVMPIASISKLVSAMVVLDARLDMNQPITITEAEIDRIKGTSSRLSVGTTLTRGELLHIGLMSSENRAIHALARTYPGGMGAFVNAMNRKVQSLGMRNSYFYEPTGLHSGNVSTANDLALLVRAASQYPLIRSNTTSNYGQVITSNGRTQIYKNSNALVREGQWPIRLQKTGYIRESGRSMVLEAVIQNQPVIIVLLDSATSATRVNDARKIENWMLQGT